MKKNKTRPLFYRSKTILFSILLFISMMGNLNAAVIQIKGKIIKVNEKNINLNELVWNIKKLTGYEFVCDSDDLKQYKNISINKKGSIEEILNEVLQNTNLTYSFEDNIYVIKRKIPVVKSSNQKKKNRIIGKVTDKKGLPLPGVSVIIKGTTTGVATNPDGEYSIEIEDNNAVLLVSFVGMITQEIKYKGQKQIDIELKENSKAIGEIIVNGYKSVSRDHFTGNAVTVGKKELLKKSSQNIVAALEYYDPSFRLEPNNNWGSDPNAMPEFNIRGNSSIGMEKGLDVEKLKQDQRTSLANNPNMPIFIVDGFEVDVQKVYDMDMNRVDNVTILKDAASTALYGSRAANGVVLISTILPKSGSLRINYNFTGTVELPDLSDYNLCNAEEKLEAEKFAGVYSEDGAFSAPLEEEYYKKYNAIKKGVNTDWLAQPIRNVFNQKHNLYIEGGVKNIRYGFDLYYNSNKGIMKGSHRDRANVGFVFGYKTKKLKILNKINYSIVDSEDSKYGYFSDFARMQPYLELTDENGELYKDYSHINSKYGKNPLYAKNLESYRGRNNMASIVENFELEYSLTDKIRFATQLNFQKTIGEVKDYNDPRELMFINRQDDEKGSLSKTNTHSENYNVKTLLTYSNTFKDHFVNIVAGAELSKDRSNSSISRYLGFAIPNLSAPELAAKQDGKTINTDSESRTLGFLTSANYSLKDIYLLDASFRYDGSSKFGANKRFAPFWSVGTGINIHKYSFIEGLGFINRLKIRSTYGSLGNVQFPPYTAITTYEIYKDKWTQTGMAASLKALGNEDLKWETTKIFDYGIDLTLANGRFNLSATKYSKITSDLISDLYLRRSSGFESYKINSGEVKNTGFELSFNAIAHRGKNLIVTVYGNISSNKNEISKLSEAMEVYNEEIKKNYTDNQSTTNEYSSLRTIPINQYYKGASTTAIYAVRSQGIDPANGKERFLTKDGNITYSWNANDQVVVGDTRPDASGSFGCNVSYKGFFLSSSFRYQWGAQVYNRTLVQKIEMANVETENVDRRFLTDRWKQPGDLTVFSNISDNNVVYPTSRMVQDDDFVELSNLTLGYDFKSSFVKKLGLGSLGIRLMASNLERWSKIRMERGLAYPYSKNYSVTLNMSF